MIPPLAVYAMRRARGLGPHILGALEAHRHLASPQTVRAIPLTVTHLAVHHVWCRRIDTCKADWAEAITLGRLRPRCRHCKRLLP